MSKSNKISFPNYTPTPNIVYDYWMRTLNGSEYKVLSCMCRETFGYQCRETTNKDYCSIEYISEYTGLNRDTVINSIKILCDYDLIIKIPLGKSNNYKINIYDPSQVGISDLTSQVGNSDLIKSEFPTCDLHGHTYNTKKEQIKVCTVCSDSDSENKKALEMERLAFKHKTKNVVMRKVSDIKEKLEEDSEGFSKKEIEAAVETASKMQNSVKLNGTIDAYVKGIILQTRKQKIKEAYATNNRKSGLYSKGISGRGKNPMSSDSSEVPMRTTSDTRGFDMSKL